ncbi:MAG: hypothetical protein M1839_002021 [Geoglossum umbratile]|nr:MAG: hypothetical protein M1839_002021 [Geoglossum umbratile]
MVIVHIVLFEFNPSATPEAIQDVCQRMLALKDQCIHPTTNKPYLKSSIGGRDNSPEELQVSIYGLSVGSNTDLAMSQRGMTHAFIVEFENEADRNYYINGDPVHRAFVSSLGYVVARVQVLDFVPGAF